MARFINRLTTKGIQRLGDGWHADGGNLYLRVEGAGRWWCFRYGAGGTRYHGLGPAHTVTLAEAREQARGCRKLLLQGRDPIAEGKARRAAAAVAGKTFGECVTAYYEVHRGSWSNAKHEKEWLASLEAHVLPEIGELAVGAIDTSTLMRVLQPIWQEIPQTAGRIRSRVEQVLDWAKVNGYRDGENPARWRGHLAKLLPSPKKIRKVKHHAALPYAELPAFMAELRQRQEIEARALEFIILTSARSDEACAGNWNEIDTRVDRDGWVWIVPADRIKARREHRVPLSAAARAVLELTPQHQRHGALFPDVNPNAVWKLLREELHDTATVHGFRSTFRDWSGELTNFPREAAELALAHRVGDETERAYARGDLLRKRRQLAEAWGRYCASTPPARTADVVSIGA